VAPGKVDRQGPPDSSDLGGPGGGLPGANGQSSPTHGLYETIVVMPSWQQSNAARLHSLDLGSLAAPDSVVWLWTNVRGLPDALSLLEGWGFLYANLLTWVTPKGDSGEVLEERTRLCVLGVRGKRPDYHSTDPNIIIQSGRNVRRSWEAFLTKVERVSRGPKLAVPGDPKLAVPPGRKGWAVHEDGEAGAPAA
jgi:N6-adenosine-specific RNA methylase IME4